MSSDENDNLWEGWENGPTTVAATDLPKQVPLSTGKGQATLQLGHLSNVDINNFTDMANGAVAFPSDPTQLAVAILPPSGRSKKERRVRVMLVDDGETGVKAVPLSDKQDIQIVKDIAGDKYDQAAFLRAMRGAATPQDGVAKISDAALRAKFERAGNIIFGTDTVVALKVPRKRPAPKKPPAEASPPPALLVPAAPASAVSVARSPVKRRAVDPAPPSKRRAAAPAADKPAPKKMRVTVAVEVDSLEELAGLFTAR